MNIRVSIIALLLGISCTTNAQEPAQVTSEILIQTTTSWDGSPLPAYPDGQPQITVSRITIPSGTELGVHKHPIPLSAYVVSGELTVIKNDTEQQIFTAGQAIVETVDIWHYGRNAGSEDVVLIAFYAGIEGTPLSISQD